MSKTTMNSQHNDTLTDNELDAVAGGLVVREQDERDYIMIYYGRAAAGAVTAK